MNVVSSEIKCQRILSPSSITLGDYVINPYRGCTLGCRYCYVQKNKGVEKRGQPWGSFVDVKVNVPELLEKELVEKRPQRVLIGSTTESYQPCEEKYELMRTILTILNAHNVGCTILTKSPLIERDIDLLTYNPNPHVYFTVHPYSEKIRRAIEPATSSFSTLYAVISKLAAYGITVHVYINPVIPYLVAPDYIFKEFRGVTPYIDFEGINVKMVDWDRLRACLMPYDAANVTKIDAVFAHEDAWNEYWKDTRINIHTINTAYNYTVRTFFHPFEEYFGTLPY